MRDIPRRRVWRFCLAWIVLAGAVSMPAWAPSAHAATSWEDHPAHRAVWKIIDTKRGYQASAFAVGPRLVVTVAHNLFDVVWKAGTDKMVLDQAGRDGRIEIVRARAISATHDLALLETATSMAPHLTIAKALPQGLADQFHAAGYPKRRFQTLSVIAQTIHGGVDYYNIAMDRIVRGGVSGGPVLAPNGKVIAMMRTSNGNVAGAVRFETLEKFLKGEIGVDCGASGLEGCLEEAARRTKQLAEGGGSVASFAKGRCVIRGLPVHLMILRWPDGPVAVPWPRSGRTVRDRRRARRSGPRRQCRPGGRTSRPGPCAARASPRSP